MTPNPVERRILLASEVRSGSQVVLPVVNPGWSQVMLWCQVTVNPGAAETISIAVRTHLPDAAGNVVTLRSTTPDALGGGPGTLSRRMGAVPMSEGWGTAVKRQFQSILPFLISFAVTVSGAGDWTYTFGYDAKWGV